MEMKNTVSSNDQLPHFLKFKNHYTLKFTLLCSVEQVRFANVIVYSG